MAFCIFDTHARSPHVAIIENPREIVRFEGARKCKVAAEKNRASELDKKIVES